MLINVLSQIFKRGAANNYDPGSISNMEFNSHSGAQKVNEVGKLLVPIYTGGNYTTNVTSATSLPALGKNIAVYNNSGSVETITMGNASTVTSLAAGVTDNTTGNVGIPCAPNSWTYLACSLNQWIIASSANLLVFLIADDTKLIAQSQANAPT